MRRKCRVTSRGVLTEQMGSTAPRDCTSSTSATLEPRLRAQTAGLPASAPLPGHVWGAPCRLPTPAAQGIPELGLCGGPRPLSPTAGRPLVLGPTARSRTDPDSCQGPLKATWGLGSRGKVTKLCAQTCKLYANDMQMHMLGFLLDWGDGTGRGRSHLSCSRTCFLAGARGGSWVMAAPGVGSCSVGWPQGPGPCCAQGRLGGHGALPRDRPSPRPPAGPLAPVPTGGVFYAPEMVSYGAQEARITAGDPGWWPSGARRVRWQQRLWVQIEKVPGGEPWRGTARAPSSQAVSRGPREEL